tara:strand:- start:6162 stop:6695 length:534 start_codon:yes stop_codon:yes gene_type:complete
MEQSNFVAAIPGQSLTREIGSALWQKPSQYSTVEEASEYYTGRIFNSSISEDLKNVIEMDIPLTSIANSLQIGSVMQGKHTIDIGIICLPIIVELLVLFSEEEGIDYFIGTEKEKMPYVMSDTMKAKLQYDVEKNDNIVTSAMNADVTLEDVEEEEEEDVDESKTEELVSGLMSRSR